MIDESLHPTLGMKNGASILFEDGLRGTLQSNVPDTDGRVEVLLSDGRHALVSTDCLEERPDGSYYLPLATAAGDCEKSTASDTVEGTIGVNATPNAEAAIGSRIIMVAEERVDIQKRPIEIARVRVTKSVETREEVVDVPLEREEISIERVVIDRFVTSPPPVRYEKDVVVISVVEEVLVVEKRLRVKEEVRVITRRVHTTESRAVTLRSEKVHVDRAPLT